jgi:hypothetical protein
MIRIGAHEEIAYCQGSYDNRRPEHEWMFTEKSLFLAYHYSVLYGLHRFPPYPASGKSFPRNYPLP